MDEPKSPNINDIKQALERTIQAIHEVMPNLQAQPAETLYAGYNNQEDLEHMLHVCETAARKNIWVAVSALYFVHGALWAMGHMKLSDVGFEESN